MTESGPCYHWDYIRLKTELEKMTEEKAVGADLSNVGSSYIQSIRWSYGGKVSCQAGAECLDVGRGLFQVIRLGCVTINSISR